MKKTFGAVLLVAIAVTVCWNSSQNKNETNLTELTLANINALARNESDKVDCSKDYGKGCWNGYQYYLCYTEKTIWQ